jgi:hypothetical protein
MMHKLVPRQVVKRLSVARGAAAGVVRNVVDRGGSALAEQMRDVAKSIQEVNANLRLEGLRMIWEQAHPVTV